MKQRVNFIRAILAEPDILLLDEPFASLDKKSRQKMIEMLHTYYDKKEVTSILVTHSNDEAKLLSSKIFDITLNKIVDVY
jgi:ABC-type nitrate/sulfonate/bicarbonate transport system ATPase subunit